MMTTYTLMAAFSGLSSKPDGNVLNCLRLIYRIRAGSANTLTVCRQPAFHESRRTRTISQRP